MRTRVALTLLCVCACSQDKLTVAPDAQPKMMMRDSGTQMMLDAGRVDTGVAPDSGVPPDSGVIDSGVTPDTGVPPYDGGVQACPDGDEGCLCQLGGTCNDPGLQCLDSSGGLVPPQDRLFLCVRPCGTDADCVNSPVGNTLCRPLFGPDRACVSAEVGEGQVADISRLREVDMTGCPNGTIGIPQFFGLDVEEDQVSCGRACDPNAVSGPNACGTTFPYCNPGILNLPPTTGICGARRAGPGDTCSQKAITHTCAADVPNLACIGVPYDVFDPTDPSPTPDPGICMQFCDLGNPNCLGSDDPGAGPATCQQIRAMDPMLGICSNNCSRFPSTCQRAGGYGEGSSCSTDLSFEMGLDIQICISVVAPPIPEWDFMAVPIERCQTSTGGELRCEAGTFCADDGNGGVCVRGCSTATATTGCENDLVNPVCNDGVLGDPMDTIGACAPQ